MEDCFVAAQKGALSLSPTDIDVLLRGVDLLGKISEATKEPNLDLSDAFDGPVRSLVVELEAMLVPGGKPGGGPTPIGASAELTTPSVPGATTIAGPEFLDATAAEEIRRQFLSAIEGGCDTVRFDLRATKDLDVQGLALLAAVAQHNAKHERPRVRLAGVSAEMQTVLEVTGLGQSYADGPDATPEDQ
jgi:anti-anti-sigma regulatory factor